MMPYSQKCRILIYNSSKGVEFSLSLSGAEQFQKVSAFLQKIDPEPEQHGVPPKHNRSTQFYVLDDERIAELGALMKQTK